MAKQLKPDTIKSAPGSYVLVFQCLVDKQLEVGKWGLISIEPGYYLYVGSAFGPGGVKARVARHYRTGKKKHWHIDYLREHLELTKVWYSSHNEKLEHHWARTLSAMPKTEPVQGFGCSDCQCHSHLFRSVKRPAFSQFCKTAGGNILSITY